MLWGHKWGCNYAIKYVLNLPTIDMRQSRHNILLIMARIKQVRFTRKGTIQGTLILGTIKVSLTNQLLVNSVCLVRIIRNSSFLWKGVWTELTTNQETNHAFHLIAKMSRDHLCLWQMVHMSNSTSHLADTWKNRVHGYQVPVGPTLVHNFPNISRRKTRP